MKPHSIPSYMTAGIIGGLLVIIAVGCQSGFNKPDLNKLAFWKKEELRLASRSDDIPPPSAQFNPDRNESGESETREKLQASVNAIAAEAKSNRDNPTDPIRKPYSLDSIDARIEQSDSNDGKNDFVSGEKLNQIRDSTNNALVNAENAIKQTGALVEDTGKSIAGWKNDLQNTGEQQMTNAANFLKSETDKTIATASNAVDRVADTTKSTVSSTLSNVKDSIDNAFQPGSGAGCHVVKNPYASSSQSKSPDHGDFPVDSDEFVNSSGGSTDTGASIDSSVSNSPTGVQQSSFGSYENLKKAGLLKPVESAVGAELVSDTGDSMPTKYPSTSFGQIRPVQQESDSMGTGSQYVPYQLLRGSSSFSPGSTTALQPADSGN